jgi:ComF family protein
VRPHTEEVYATAVGIVCSHPLRAALAALLPSGCASCGTNLAWDESAPLCPRCASRLRRPLSPACRGCGRPLVGVSPSFGATALCGACRRVAPPWTALAAAYLYLPPMVDAVRALKFGRAEHVGEAFAATLADACAPWARDLDVITPVPLAWNRLLSRGYNQAEAVARPLAARLGLPCRRLLRRRPRPRQALLGRRERERNLGGAFQATGAAARAARVLLVDDVMTTGATLRAAASALRRAGVLQVFVAVAARTPDATWGEPETVIDKRLHR